MFAHIHIFLNKVKLRIDKNKNRYDKKLQSGIRITRTYTLR